MLLLRYAFSIGESITRHLKIYFGIQSSCAASLGPRAAAALLEKPELGSPMKKGSQLVAQINLAGLATASWTSPNLNSNCHLQREAKLIYSLLL